MTNSAGVTAVDIERLRMWPDALKNQRMIGLPDTLRDDLRSAADEIERLRALPPPEAAGARREWANEIEVADMLDKLVDEMFTDRNQTAAAEIRQLLWDNKIGFIRLAQSLKSPAPSAPPPHSQASEVVEALHKLAIVPGTAADNLRCKLCNSEWDYRDEEKHIAGCALSRQAPQPADMPSGHMMEQVAGEIEDALSRSQAQPPAAPTAQENDQATREEVELARRAAGKE